jgi:hypothetical protein
MAGIADLKKKVGYVGPTVSDIPREFGEGEHFVKLAYITPAEASLLEKVDLHDSNPPHTGPEIKNIPNYNDFGGGGRYGGYRSGAAMSAAEKGNFGSKDVKASGMTQKEAKAIAAGAKAAAQGQKASKAFQQAQKQQTTTTPTTKTPDDDKEYTSSIIDALFTGKTYKKETQAERIKKQIANLQPRFQNQLLNRLKPLGITNLDQLTDAALTQAYNEGDMSLDELKGALMNPANYVQAAYGELAFGGLPTIGQMAVPLTMGQFMYDVFTDQPKNLMAAMGPFDVDLAPYQGSVMNFSPQQMQDLSNLQGGLTNTQIGQTIQGTLGRAESQQATRGPQEIYVPPTGGPVGGAVGGGAVGGGAVGGTTGPQIDFNALYNSMTEAQKATIDKITQLPEYDLPFGVRYIQQGGPLF